MADILAARPLDYWLLWIVALFAGGVALAGLYFLATARQLAVESARLVGGALHRIDEASVSCLIDVREQIPIDMKVPLDTTVTVPLDLTIPVETDVTVDVRTPLGSWPITLPIRARVPVRIDVAIPVRAEIPVTATVPVDMSIPVELKLADLTLSETLRAGIRVADRTIRRLWAGLVG